MFRNLLLMITSIVASLCCVEIALLLGPVCVQAAIVVPQDVDKSAVPTAEVQIKCLAEIRKEFADRYAADTPESRVELSQYLLMKAGEKKSDATLADRRYCLRQEALRLAVETCEAGFATIAINGLNESHELEFWELVGEATQKLRKAAKNDDQRRSVRSAIDEFVEQAVVAEQFDAAYLLIGRAIAIESAMKQGDREEKGKLAAYKKDISLMRSLSKAGAKAKIRLQSEPDDPKSNLDFGNYLILIKSDFENGLGHWSRCSDAKYKKIAQVEMKAVDDNPQALAGLARRWSALGDQSKGLRKRRFKERAFRLFEKSVAGLDGAENTAARSEMNAISVMLDIKPDDNVAGNQIADAGAEGDGELAKSVDAALNWIVAHQLPDGGWSFDHTIGPGDFRQTSGAGELKEARSGATALALIALVKAGSTTKDGKYKAAVISGFNFLSRRGKIAGGGVSYMETGGTMYSHGLAARAFCDLYQKTKKRDHGKFAQAACNFIQEAQDPRGGGWRYVPRQPGDTSVLGWQLAALESAQLGGLSVRRETGLLTERFLDSVMSGDGLRYGYTSPPTSDSVNASTAIGGLARIQLGREVDDPLSIKAGKILAERGPRETHGNVYYTYYATQAMRRLGGNDWDAWKERTHAGLLRSQRKLPNELGSWWFDGSKDMTASKGGRLTLTVFSVLTLLE